MNSETEAMTLPRWWIGLNCLAVLSLPFTLSLPLPLLAKRSIHLTLFDPLIWASASLLILLQLFSAETRRPLRHYLRLWASVTWPAGVLLIVGLISLRQVENFDRQTLVVTGKNIFQFCEYLFVTPLALLPMLYWPKWRPALRLSIAGALLVTLIRAPFWIDNHHVHGMLVALLGCLCLEMILVTGKHPSIRLGIGLLGLALIAIVRSGESLLACLLGFLIVLALRSRIALVSLLVLFFLGLWIFPQRAAKRAVLLAESLQTFRTYRRPGEIMPRTRPTMRAYRWHANLNMIAQNSTAGVGWGRYQRYLDRYYGSLDVPEGRTDAPPEWHNLLTHEPGTYSWFMLTAAETGLPGLAALFLFLAVLLGRAMRINREKRLIGAGGIAGAVVALLLLGLWTNPMVRGAGPVLGLLLTLSTVRLADDSRSALGAEWAAS